MQKQVSYKAIGRNIRMARKQEKLTQENVADMVGMSALHYGRLERGERRASLEQIVAIGKALHVSAESLMKGMTETCEKETSGKPTQFALIMEDIGAGCSSDACDLMLSVCRLIAEKDKS